MNNPADHWVDMPEFEQPKQAPFATLTVRVRNAEDLAKLAELTGNKLTAKTKSVWFPKLEPTDTGMKRWK